MILKVDMNKIILLLLASVLSSVASAAPINVSKSVVLDANIEKVWPWIGGFCSIRFWHPAIEQCEVVKEGEAEFRILTLGDGGKIKERYSSGQVYGYSYEIVESPLPVKNYRSNFMAEPVGGKVKFTWSVTFLADGKTDAEAEAVVAGIFESGMKSIEKRYMQRIKKRAQKRKNNRSE